MNIREDLLQLFAESLGPEENLPVVIQREMESLREAVSVIELSSMPPLQVFADIDAMLEKTQAYMPPDQRKEYLRRIRALCLSAAASLVGGLAKAAFVGSDVPEGGTELFR